MWPPPSNSQRKDQDHYIFSKEEITRKTSFPTVTGSGPHPKHTWQTFCTCLKHSAPCGWRWGRQWAGAIGCRSAFEFGKWACWQGKQKTFQTNWNISMPGFKTNFRSGCVPRFPVKVGPLWCQNLVQCHILRWGRMTFRVLRMDCWHHDGYTQFVGLLECCWLRICYSTMAMKINRSSRQTRSWFRCGDLWGCSWNVLVAFWRPAASTQCGNIVKLKSRRPRSTTLQPSHVWNDYISSHFIDLPLSWTFRLLWRLTVTRNWRCRAKWSWRRGQIGFIELL